MCEVHTEKSEHALHSNEYTNRCINMKVLNTATNVQMLHSIFMRVHRLEVFQRKFYPHSIPCVWFVSAGWHSAVSLERTIVVEMKACAGWIAISKQSYTVRAPKYRFSDFKKTIPFFSQTVWSEPPIMTHSNRQISMQMKSRFELKF